MTFKLFDTVVLRIDIPAAGVMADAVGAIIDAYPDGAFEVKFDQDADQNLVTAALRADQIAVVAPIKRVA